jgi:DNA polymerase-1
MPSKERLFLLDGMALAYRAYFSFITRPLINSRGVNTSAIYGFVNTLMMILDDEKPDHIAVVFDTREPTFRHKMYKPYKATREKMPEDLSSQLNKLKETVEAFNVPIIELPGYEADDIMGTLAKRAEKEGIETYLVTGDKDFMQLISPLVKMFKPGKQGNEWEVIDDKNVKEKFGVDPDKVTDVLALIGDKSDNIPGVPGVGEKTAIPLVQQLGSIEDILANVDGLPQEGLKKKLKEHADKARLSKKLVTIDTNVPINVDLHRLKAAPKNVSRLIKLFGELEFKTLLKKLSDQSAQLEDDTSFDVATLELTDITSDEHRYHVITDEKSFLSLVEKLSKTKRFVFDTETTAQDPLRAGLVGLSFAMKPREAWYVPIAENREWRAKSREQLAENEELFLTPTQNLKPKTLYPTGLPLNLVISHTSPIFSNPSILKIGQNIDYDILVLDSHGVKVEGPKFDTMIANYVLRPDGQHNLDALAAEHLQYKMISYDELIGKEKNDILEIPVEKIAEYSAQDADITFRLYEILKEKLKNERLHKLCEEIEFPLIDVLADMEFTGVRLDTAILADMSKEFERMLDGLVREIYDLAGEPFNVNSTQQLGKILFEKLKLRTVRKTKTGFSTDVGVLEELQHEHPIIDKLLDYRQLQKLKSTYIDALPALINPKTGRVHTSFNQTIAVTGRLSSSDPNLQNIPIRTDVGRSIRKAFIAGEKGWLIMSADYSQIELRIMAHVSGDEGLREAFLNGEDIHATTAAKVFGVNLNEVTKDMRRKAKEVNFGIMYGIGPYGLATRLDISQLEAKEIITTYFARFPKVNQYIFDTIAKAKHDGYVSTLLGRRRYLPDINSRNQNVRGNAERQAINMPIQGSAADMIKIAMVRIHSRLRDEGMRAKMLLQVHDELVFEVAESEERRAKKMIREEMKSALPLSVPIEVEIGVGKNWYEAH